MIDHAKPDPINRRHELVLATYQLIAAKGLEGLRTRDIAAQVGINISTLHYHFETKESLIAAVVDHVTHLFKTLHAPLPAKATPLDELRHLFASQAYRRRIDPRVDVVLEEVMLRSRRDPEVKKAFDAMLRGWRAMVESIVVRGMAQRLLRADLDPKSVAAVITSFQIGANMQLEISASSLSLDDTARTLLSSLSAKPASAKGRRAVRDRT